MSWQVPNHAIPIGRGAGTIGFKSVLMGSAAVLVGQGSSTDPVAVAMSGDITMNTSGVVAIGATKVTSAMLNADVYSTAHSWGGQQTFTAPILGTPASGTLTNATGLPIATGISGLGTGVATFLATPSSANLRAALTDEVGTGSAYFVGGALGTPASATLTNATGLPLSGLSSQAAYSIVGNFTSGSAAPTASTIAALTQKASPAGTDEIMIADNAASGQLKRALVSALGGGGSGVTTLNGLTGGLVLYGPPQGRITVTTGVAAPTSSVTSATTYYYTPSGGNMVVIWDGTNLVPFAFTELTQTTTDTTKAPAACTTNSNYDLYVALSGGVPALFRSPAWSSNTSRGTGAGTAEQARLSNGIIVNAQAITNGPAAQRGTYVGTIRTNGSSAVNYIIGGAASGGTAGDMGVWNMYNRVLSVMTVKDTGAQYSYASGARQARASSGNQASAIVGLVEDAVVATYQSRIDTAATATTFGYIGIGYDSTSVISSATVYIQTVANALQFGSPLTEINHYPTLGYHTYVALEGAGGTCSFDGSSDATLAVKVWN